MDTAVSFVGIDVSKNLLDVAILPRRERLQFTNDPSGHAALVAHLAPLEGVLVVMEATGGWEAAVAAALALEGISVAVVNPRQVRHYAHAVGQLAKTDRLDAEVLARFAEAVKPMPRPLPDEQQQLIAALVTRRQQLIEMITAEHNREALAPATLQERIQAHLEWLQGELEQVDEELHDEIRRSPLWRERDRLYRSVPGVGRVVSAKSLAKVPELGTLNRKEIAALVGVAPLNRESGGWKGKRCVWGGRASVRRALYMAALVGTRHNRKLREFCQRLLASGKEKKVALVACMRKLLTWLNAMARDNAEWQVLTTGNGA